MQKYVVKHAKAAHITRTDEGFTNTGFGDAVVVNMLIANYRHAYIRQVQGY